MQITFNGVIHSVELNELLSTVGWQAEHLDLVEESLDMSWGWVTMRDEFGKLMGFVQLLSADQKHVTIFRFLIRKDQQGVGFGTQLFKSLLEILNDQNVILLSPEGIENEAIRGRDYLEQGSNRRSLFLGN